MTKNLIGIFIPLLVLIITMAFSNSFEKIAKKHDKYSTGGKGTDIYFFSSLYVIIISVGCIIYNVLRIIIYYFC